MKAAYVFPVSNGVQSVDAEIGILCPLDDETVENHTPALFAEHQRTLELLTEAHPYLSDR